MIAESTRFKTTGSSPSEGAIKQSKGKAETIQAGSRRGRVLPHLQEALLEIGVVVLQELRAPISQGYPRPRIRLEGQVPVHHPGVPLDPDHPPEHHQEPPDDPPNG